MPDKYLSISEFQARYPRNLINDSEERINMIHKYGMLRSHFIEIAQAWHLLAQEITECAHHATNFQDCNEELCREMMQVLNDTKL